MRRLKNLVNLVLCALILPACTAAMVPQTDDPKRKLGWASVLLDEQDRPIPSEKLIREAIEINQAQNDEVGLANAYRLYGFFFQSPAVARFSAYYKKNAFLDKTVAFDQRIDLSIAYSTKARNIFAKLDNPELLANVDLTLAYAYMAKEQRAIACKSFDSSLQNHERLEHAEPNAKFVLPKGIATYREFISAEKAYSKCP